MHGAREGTAHGTGAKTQQGQRTQRNTRNRQTQAHDTTEPMRTYQSPLNNKPPYSNLFSENLDKQKTLRPDNKR